MSGLTSETRAAPPRGAVLYSQSESPTRCGGQTAVSIRFRLCLSLEHVAEPAASTAPHGGAAREMEDHRVPWGGRFEMSELQTLRRRRKAARHNRAPHAGLGRTFKLAVKVTASSDVRKPGLPSSPLMLSSATSVVRQSD